MKDMGDCWFDDEMKPIIEYYEDGSIKSYMYCPYIPKFLFDGDVFRFDGGISTGSDNLTE